MVNVVYVHVQAALNGVGRGKRKTAVVCMGQTLARFIRNMFVQAQYFRAVAQNMRLNDVESAIVVALVITVQPIGN